MTSQSFLSLIAYTEWVNNCWWDWQNRTDLGKCTYVFITYFFFYYYLSVLLTSSFIIIIYLSSYTWRRKFLSKALVFHCCLCLHRWVNFSFRTFPHASFRSGCHVKLHWLVGCTLTCFNVRQSSSNTHVDVHFWICRSEEKWQSRQTSGKSNHHKYLACRIILFEVLRGLRSCGTTSGHKAKDITPSIAWRREA